MSLTTFDTLKLMGLLKNKETSIASAKPASITLETLSAGLIRDEESTLVDMALDIAQLKGEVERLRIEVAQVKSNIAALNASLDKVKAKIIVMQWVVGFSIVSVGGVIAKIFLN